uniref:Glutamine--fructose-6-phosphate aminotransferase [isomerizing] n=1 Tax=viral metagenome TaxID=1070528 RepID=A0A6C0B6X5_9ZZZZ
MCGIVAYLGNDAFITYVLSGLKLLQNRGYDSVGISCVIDNDIHTEKYASSHTYDSLEKLDNKVSSLKQMWPYCGIGHTRWATHGGKTDTNAHPHHDNKNRIALVHNGIIENFDEIKSRLFEKGYTFLSQTDTEVIAVLIGYYLDMNDPIETAIQNTLKELLGTWALVIIHKDFPNKLWITRNGSPLLLGFENEYVMVASEQIAFNNYIKKYIVIENHDLIEISKEDRVITYNKNIHRYEIKEKNNIPIELKPNGYKHWLLKEIFEQPDSVNRAINNGGRIENNTCVKLGGLDTYKSRLLEINHLIILGCGTSYNSGLWSLEIFKNLDIFHTVVVYDGAEFNVKDIPKIGNSGVILLSQSGETKDLHRCIQIAKDYDIITIGVVNIADSLIARESDCGVYLNAGREVAVASTKSFTNQCTVLTMIAIWFSQNRGTCIEKRKKIINDIRKLPFQIQDLCDNVENIKAVAEDLKTVKSLFVLGKGKEEAIAKEGALKLKEVAYIHAEGYSSSALKHGPFALIEPGLPIILLDVDDEHREKNKNTYQEVIARNAKVIKISDNKTDCLLYIEKNGTFGGVLANIYLQLLSYYLAMENDYNPDFPRNLAKVVTVE